MNEFIETKAILYDNIGEKSVYPLLLNLSKVTAVCKERFVADELCRNHRQRISW